MTTPHVVSIELDLSGIADEINYMVGRDVETAETVRAWVRDNHPNLRGMLEDAVCEAIGEAYE